MNIKQLDRGVAALTSVANAVYEWAEDAALKLNASKTKAIICGSRDFVNDIPQDLPRIEVSVIPFPYVDQAEILGVIIINNTDIFASKSSPLIFKIDDARGVETTSRAFLVRRFNVDRSGLLPLTLTAPCRRVSTQNLDL